MAALQKQVWRPVKSLHVWKQESLDIAGGWSLLRHVVRYKYVTRGGTTFRMHADLSFATFHELSQIFYSSSHPVFQQKTTYSHTA